MKRMTATEKKILAAGTAVVLCGGVGAYLLRPLQVDAVTAGEREFSTYLQCEASLKTDSVTISSAVAGKVVRVYASAGGQTTQGTLLIELDNSEAVRAYEQAKITMEMERKSQEAQRESAVAQARRIMLLAAQTSGTELYEFNEQLGTTLLESYVEAQNASEQLLSAERLQLAQLNLDAASDALNLYRYTASLNGQIGDVYVTPGQVIAAGTPLVKINCPDYVYWEAVVTENQSEDIAKGMTAALTGKAANAATETGEIVSVDTTTSQGVWGQATQTKVKIQPVQQIDVENQTKKWDMCVLTRQGRGVAVPLQSVFQKEDRLYVYAVRNGRAEAAQVQTGRISGGYVEIEKGVDAGECIVLYPEKIAEGRRVSVK
ncbi:MAG: efflux RND transporter periplasmic adaptor subunit [Eubacteriales bacterium]|nr:efflux RND transporter periplasmic adaptor subunit [Eubacteriales bacterium]